MSDSSHAGPGARLWHTGAQCAIYTLTPTHVGSGRVVGSVDLPIARDVTCGHPILPATALKGVMREYVSHRAPKDLVSALFGAELEQRRPGAEPDSIEERNRKEWTGAAGLAITEARLAAYPVRSLNRPFVYVTCPLAVERLTRDARLLLAAGPLANLSLDPPKPGQAKVAAKAMAERPLALEDLLYTADEVEYDPKLQQLAARLAGLLPEDMAAERNRLMASLVLVEDELFADLMERVVPVVARICLTGGKTTDEWPNPETGETERGNLWYEEQLPSDCLFVGHVGSRRRVYRDSDRRQEVAPLTELAKAWGAAPVVQVGGNETVGQGLCRFALHGEAQLPAPAVPAEGA